jgi:hypothetical protein
MSNPSEQEYVAWCRTCRMQFITHYGAAAHGVFARHSIVYEVAPKSNKKKSARKKASR